MSYPVENPNTILFLAFETKVGNNLISALDIAHLRHFSSILSTLDYEYFGLNQFQLNNVYFVFDWEKSFQKLALQKQFKLVKVKPSRFQRVEAGSFSFSLTFCLRPARELQNQANPIIARFKQNNLNKRIISVHRRHFGWCTPEYKHYRPFCGDKERNKGSNSFYFNDCNVTYSDQLLQFINSEWTGQQKFQRNDFVFFLATDLHDLGGDQTFYDSGVEILKIPHAENPEHVIHNELSKERRMNPNNHTKGFLKDIVLERTGVDMAWDLSMLVDMHAQTKSDLSLGAPYSSCDRILSMWRSLFGQATLISFEKYGTETNAKTIEDFVENSRDSREYYHTLPSKCYKYFENPEDGTSSVSKYRKWWQEKGVPMLATKNKLFTLTTSETAVTEIVT